MWRTINTASALGVYHLQNDLLLLGSAILPSFATNAR